MFNFGVSLKNPFGDPDKFDHVFCYEGRIPELKNKCYSAELVHIPEEIFKFEVDFTPRRRSHGGLTLDITVLGFYLHLSVYDRRHWNHDEDRWYLPGEEEEKWGK